MLLNSLTLHRGLAYIRYLLRAKTKYFIHSPFIYDFVTHVLPNKQTKIGNKIETKRLSLLSEKNRIIKFHDFGAGYQNDEIRNRTQSLHEIIKSSARTRKTGDLIYRLIKHYQPKQCLELGTNLGFSGLYISSALSNNTSLITVEGSKELLEIAEEHFNQFGYSPTLIQSRFDVFLNTYQIPNLDFTFIDGHHKYHSTIDYFNKILPKQNKNSIIIIDDIYWSKEMSKAWKEIILNKHVTISIDLFQLGILFINREQAKEDFTFFY